MKLFSKALKATFYLFAILMSNMLSAQEMTQCSMHTHSDSENGVQAIYEAMNTHIAPPADYVPNGQRSANIVVNYTGFSAQAQTAFQYAVDIWASQLTSSVTIEVDATWEPLTGGTLGAAGAFTFMTNFSGAPQSNTYYPIALANKLAGFDLDSSIPDIVATFNSTANWYYGTDGNCPSNQFDFVTVVLHELGHGLGIQGSCSYDSGDGFIGIGFPSNPIIYDRFAETGAGTDIDSYSSGTTTLGNALTDNSLYWFGTSGVAGGNGTQPRLYAPTSWNSGSSYSHLNEDTYTAGNANSLMTPFVGQAEVIHNPGPITLGVLEDIGWTLDNSSGGGCPPVAITLFDNGCQDDGYGNILPVIGMVFDIDGTCSAEDLCWGVDGTVPTCVNLPASGFTMFDGDTLNLINSDINAVYEVYFTTADGTSSSSFFTTGDCNNAQVGCTNPFAVNYDATAEVDDDSCIYDYNICDCNSTSHSAGVQVWIGDGFADQNTYEWEGQLVDFDCETWAYDCGDIAGSPSTDPWGVCAGDLPPNNGCAGGGCTPTSITLFDNGCQDDGYGNILPVIGMVFDIDGICNVEDLCWGVDGVVPTCVNLPVSGFDMFDGDTLNLINSDINAVYEVYFTTTDGTSSSSFFTTGDCSGSVFGCTNPFAANYNANADVDDNSCIYDYNICDCSSTSHSAGVQVWIGDGFADQNTYEWEGQLVNFDCETWAYDCGDIAGSPSTDPWGVCSGDLPPNNGCAGVDCLPAGLTLYDAGCLDDGYGLLPVIGMVFDINGTCQAEDVCWGINGAAPSCVNLPANALDIFDGDTLNLINSDINSTYEIYFTTTDGSSSSFFFTTGDCTGGIVGCTDPNACNYDPNATDDNGSCEYVSCAGCTNANACNYDPNASIDDGTCEFVSCAGCTDPAACNFDETATIDDGSCLFDCNGCTDPAALNYNPDALVDDGSCIYECDYPVIQYEAYCADGEMNQFYIEVSISDLGNGSPYIVSNNVDSDVIDLNFVGSIDLGPFDNLDEVVVSVESSTLTDCIITSPLLTLDCTVGVDEFEALGMSAYPNPFGNRLIIDLGTHQECDVVVFDGMGQRVIEMSQVQSKFELDTDHMAKGMYFLFISNDEVNAVHRLVKE